MPESQTVTFFSGNDQAYIGSHSSGPPLTLDDIDRWAAHIGLQEFAKGLEAAAKAVFPNETRSRYTKVFVLILCWEDEDPELPVSIEIEKLYSVFRNIYHFEIETWKIPDKDSHLTVNTRIVRFAELGGNRTDHLKIIYYAGHARLTTNRLLTWTSWRNKKKTRCPIVKWSGIQNILEEANSDVLVLLDCCASGTANTNEGEGSTELLAACAYNSTANGVGPYSFTSALVTELRLLSKRTSFSTGELYSNIFCRIQSRMPDDEIERHPAPVHIVLTQDSRFPRSIRLSVQPEPEVPEGNSAPDSEESIEATEEELFPEVGSQNRGAAISTNSTEYGITSSSADNHESPFLVEPQNVPRLAFAIRLKDDLDVGELSEGLFLEWLRNFPTVAAEVKVEAGFSSFSTLIVISIPLSISSYFPRHPAVIPLGPVTSRHWKLSGDKDMVDRQLLSKYFLQFLASDSTEARKKEALQQIAILLEWTHVGADKPSLGTTMLCSKCQAIDLEALVLGRDNPYDKGKLQKRAGYLHHINYAALKNAAENGCEFCSSVRLIVDKNDGEVDVFDHGEFPVQGVGDWKELAIALRLVDGHAGKEDSFLVAWCGSDCGTYWRPHATIAVLRVFLEESEMERKTGNPDMENLARKEIGGRPLNESAFSENSFRMATTWLERCLGAVGDVNTHKFCNSSVSDFMPSRTINVGPADGSCEPFLQVHNNKPTSESPGERRYASLSHCWGGSSPLLTTIQTLEDLKKQVPLERLPQSFKDAVLITRKLGLRHLWIDSLCIIQDSKEDWQAEASKMGEVYKHSFINIAADAAGNCYDGIFKPRSSKFTPIKLPLRCEGGSFEGHVMVGPILQSIEVAVWGPRSTLAQRAWVLQESLLSPRTLHYTEEEIFWECREATWKESVLSNKKFDDGYKADLMQVDWYFNKRFITSPDDIYWYDLEHAKKHHTKMRWYSIVENYSRRKLTFPTDVFPALSGLASSFQTSLEDFYIAGLFLADIRRGLCWKPLNPRIATRKTGKRAPSWSWASITGQVSWSYSLGSRDDWYKKPTPAVHVPGGEVLSRSSDSTRNLDGIIDNGRIQMRGLWLTIEKVDLGPTHEFHVEGEVYTYEPDVIAQNTGATVLPEAVNGHAFEIGIFYLGTYAGSFFALLLIANSGPMEEYQRFGFFERGTLRYPQLLIPDEMKGWEMKTLTLV